jgi:membrane-bound metal-dependent hydrolase YbcI (DUF457 family)
MGAALLCKPFCKSSLSLITFGIAQIAMDIEPGIGMLTGSRELHGFSHTIVGAIMIAFVVILISPTICSAIFRKANKELGHYRVTWLIFPERWRYRDVLFSALFGTLSHVVLDSIMHTDIRPLAPFSESNPIFGLISHDSVYEICTLSGIVGIFIWVLVSRRGRKKAKQ